MKRFIIKLLLFIFLLILLDQIIGTLCEYYFFQTRDGDTGGQINMLLEKKSQVIVFGSSKAESQYDPEILSKIIGKSVFDAGFKASNGVYDYGVEQLVLNTYKPDLLIYDLTQITLYKSDFSIYEKLYPLYPYWHKPYIWKLIKLKDSYEPFFFLSKIYPYNSKVHSIILFNILKNRPGIKNGYKPQPAVMDQSVLIDNQETFDNVDRRLIDYFMKFILLAKDKKIKVIVVRSPRYYEKGCDLPVDISNFLKVNEVPVLDFSPQEYPQFKNYELYHDRFHLNQKGASIFTALLGQKIKSLEKD